jgi:hypothetical protein
MTAESPGLVPLFSSLPAHARRATLAVLWAARAGLGAAVAHALTHRRSGVDITFILVIAGLYAVSHWIAWAISRLGSES